MEKKTDRGVDKAMNEKDLEYLGNTNTQPGPNAGRSIDPTKPGPDAEREMTDEERQKLCADLRQVYRYIDNDEINDMLWRAADEIERLNLELGHERDVRAEAERGCVNMAKEIERLAALAQSDADDPGDATWRNLKKRMDMGMEEAIAALAQSDAEPQETRNKQPPGPDSILHELGDCPTQSDADRPLGFRTNDVPNPYAEGPQSDTEPVAWQYREPNGEWQMCDAATDVYYRTSKYEMRPLYTAQPRPDASAELIEAAEIAESLAREFERRHDELRKYSLNNDHRWIDFYPRIAQGCEEAAMAIRACAADRSGK